MLASDATHPGEMTDPGEAWPLPKRLRVRLQTSAERFGKDTDLDERLRLAERLQVRRAPPNARSVRCEGLFFLPERRFTVRVRARGRPPETRSARAHHDCMAELEAIRRRNASLCFARRGYPPTHAASEPQRTFRDTHASFVVFAPRDEIDETQASVSSIFVFVINAFPDSFPTPRLFHLFHLFHLFPRTNVDRPLPEHKRITKN